MLVTDREQLKELAKVWRSAAHVANSAATIALVLPRTEHARLRPLQVIRDHSRRPFGEVVHRDRW